MAINDAPPFVDGYPLPATGLNRLFSLWPNMVAVTPTNTPGDSSLIQSALDAAAAAGGGLVVLRPGTTAAIDATLTISSSNVGILCPSGGGLEFNVPSPVTGCNLKWVGAAGGTIMSIVAPTSSPSTDPHLVGNTVSGIFFDGNGGLAANGLVLQTVSRGVFDHLNFLNFDGGIGVDVNVVHAPLQAGTDSQKNRFTNLDFNFFGSTSIALRLGAWLDTGLPNGGGNCSLNLFENITIGYNNSTGILFDGADTNIMVDTALYRAGGGAGVGIDFSIFENIVGPFPANGNTLIGLSTNGETIARGTISFPSAVPYTGAPSSSSCTFGNTILSLDKGNSSPNPTVETGAQISWTTTDGIFTNSFWRTSAAGLAAGAVWNNGGVLNVV